VLDVANEEGLTDVFLFGASLGHTTLTVPNKWFRLIPASPYTPDTRQILQHSRWRSVFDELAQNQSTLLVYLPIDVDGASAFSDRVGPTVVLAAAADMEWMRVVLASDANVIGVMMPAQAETETETVASEPEPISSPSSSPPPPPSPSPEFDKLDDREFEKIRIPKDGAREALIADLRARQRAALMGPAPEMEPLPHEPVVALPSAESHANIYIPPGQPSPTPPPPIFELLAPQPTPKGSERWLKWLLLLLLVAAAGAAAWYVWQTRFAGADRPSAETQRPVSSAMSATSAAFQRDTSVLPYSVAIASYYDLEVALGRLDQLVEQAPNLQFYIGPIDVQGRVFYRIMAGPLPDSGTAVSMRDTLVARRIKTISSGWDVLNTPYAFLLGHYSRRDDAEAQRDIAASKGVPSYVVAIGGTDGLMQYNVYAGAYTGPGDAEFMRGILKRAGFPDNLVERTGSIRS
jgi:hypothetical protein